MNAMKLFHKLLTSVLCASLLASVSASGANNVTIGAGANNIIVAPPKSKTCDMAVYNRRYAAKELADYLQKITGEKIPVANAVSKKRIKQGGVIFVGVSKQTKHLKLGTNQYDFGKGGFLIKVIDGNLYILGHDTSKYAGKIDGRVFGETGTYYGICEFLERFAGVRWLWPGDLGTVIPKRKIITIPSITEIRSQPAALYRSDGEYKEVCNHKLNDGTLKVDYNWRGKHNLEFWLFQRRQKAGKSFFPRTAHMLKNYLSDDLFITHPEYFSYYNGKRQPFKKPHGYPQFCVSNPEVVDMVVNKIIERSKKFTQSELAERTFSLSPNDGYRFCMCKECKKLDAGATPWAPNVTGHGKVPGKVYNDKIGAASNISNRMWGFISKIGKKLDARGCDANVGCIAYSNYEKPPSKITKLSSNVFVSICDYYYMIGTPEKYKEGKKYLLEWGRRASQFGFHLYYFGIAPRTRRLGEFMRFTHNLGVKSYYAETNQTWGFKWIQYVLSRKCSWNPNLNIDEVVRDYFNAAYGKGVPAMLKYLELQEKIAMRYNVYSTFQQPKVITRNWSKDVRVELRKYLDEALKATKDDPECQARVRFTETAWEMLDSYCELAAVLKKLKKSGLAIPFIDFEGNDGRIPPISPETLNSLIKNGIIHWERLEKVMKSCESQQGWSIPWYSFFVGPNAREGRVIYAWGKTMGDLKRQLEGKALPLPLRWAFQVDPKRQGESAGWYKINTNTDGWDSLRTDLCWEKQGYGMKKYPENNTDGYNGLAWYRTSITIPAKHKGQKAWLKLGAVDESCVAWFNDKKIGSYDYFTANDPDGWLKAKVFEISGLIKYGEANSVVVMVSDKTGAGGIWKPCSIVFEDKKKRAKNDH